MAAALAARTTRGMFPYLKFVILLAGDTSMLHLEPTALIDVPSLHIFGSKDRTTPCHESAKPAGKIRDTDQYCHALKHVCFPKKRWGDTQTRSVPQKNVSDAENGMIQTAYTQ